MVSIIKLGTYTSRWRKLRVARATAKIPNSSRNGPSSRSAASVRSAWFPSALKTGSGSPEGRLRVAKYDVAIIGSGPGGYVAAIRAGELGLKPGDVRQVLF